MVRIDGELFVCGHLPPTPLARVRVVVFEYLLHGVALQRLVHRANLHEVHADVQAWFYLVTAPLTSRADDPATQLATKNALDVIFLAVAQRAIARFEQFSKVFVGILLTPDAKRAADKAERAHHARWLYGAPSRRERSAHVVAQLLHGVKPLRRSGSVRSAPPRRREAYRRDSRRVREALQDGI